MLNQIGKLILRNNGESLAEVGDNPIPAFSCGDDPDGKRKHLRLFLLQPAAVIAVIFFTLLSNFDRRFRVQVDLKEPPVPILTGKGDREEVGFRTRIEPCSL